ncbi:uncharacterized protein LOC143201430 isoform X14 [Rhynchophorus ferrugineus]|uniref:uncharacterized protein LOC143201430 isoform X14 n=1 Tax=Rhynchophorus ferrugineus TaxID=354439 RepID=UPI003FCDB989
MEVIYFLPLAILVLFILSVAVRMCKRDLRNRKLINGLTDDSQPQDQNVFNISSRVQGQEQRHPDAFVSLEHITIMNELNKPPKYDDAPPSYEEAIKIAMAQDNSLKTFQTEVAASQGTSSSSSAAATSSAATPQIQPAIPNRTE